MQKINRYFDLSHEELKKILYFYGPVTVSFEAKKDFFFFKGLGIYSECPARTRVSQINHAVLLIGWTESGDWIIKNSWGTEWGNQGFAIISKERDCGIRMFVEVLEVVGAGPPNIFECGNGRIEEGE